MGVITPATVNVPSLSTQDFSEFNGANDGTFYDGFEYGENDYRFKYSTTVRFSAGGTYACEITGRVRNEYGYRDYSYMSSAQVKEFRCSQSFATEEFFHYSVPFRNESPPGPLHKTRCSTLAEVKEMQKSYPPSYFNLSRFPKSGDWKPLTGEIGRFYASFLAVRIITATGSKKWIIPDAVHTSDNYRYSEQFTLTDQEAGNNTPLTVSTYITAPDGYSWSHNFPAFTKDLKLNFRCISNNAVPQTTWAESPSLIKGSHIQEIRTAIQKLEISAQSSNNCGYSNCCQSCQNSCIPQICQSCQSCQDRNCDCD